jgi:hypothetical protein
LLELFVLGRARKAAPQCTQLEASVRCDPQLLHDHKQRFEQADERSDIEDAAQL